MRAMLETDVIVGGLLSSVGAAARVLDAWGKGEFTLCMAPAQRAEVAAVLRRPGLAAYVEPMRVAQFLADLERTVESLERLRAVARLPDAASNALLGYAEAGRVEVLVVTEEEGARRALETFGVTRILSAREFAGVLATG